MQLHPRIVPTLPNFSIEIVIEFVIQTLHQIHCTIKSTLRSDPRPSVHVYAQEHTSIYIYIYIYIYNLSRHIYIYIYNQIRWNAGIG